MSLMNKPETDWGNLLLLFAVFCHKGISRMRGNKIYRWFCCQYTLYLFWTSGGFQNTNHSLLFHCFKTKVDWQRSQRRRPEIGLFWLCAILSDSVVCFSYATQVRVCGKCLYKRGLFTARIITCWSCQVSTAFSLQFCSPESPVLWKYNGRSYCCSYICMY